MTIADLEIHRVRIERIRGHEILHDDQRGLVDAIGQFLVVGILDEDFDVVDSGRTGDAADGNSPVEGCFVGIWVVDGAVAGRFVPVLKYWRI